MYRHYSKSLGYVLPAHLRFEHLKDVFPSGLRYVDGHAARISRVFTSGLKSSHTTRRLLAAFVLYEHQPHFVSHAAMWNCAFPLVGQVS